MKKDDKEQKECPSTFLFLVLLVNKEKKEKGGQ
jgi:hypothetical protein